MQARRKAIALLTAKEIFDLVRDDLIMVEDELARQSDAAFPTVSEITAYLLGGGGKRLRPALLLLSARYAGRRDRSAIRLAAVVELLHSATLIHDDVIDSADTRRGRPSANSRWGNHRSVLTGDWLYMQSFQMALEEHNFRILDILIDLTRENRPHRRDRRRRAAARYLQDCLSLQRLRAARRGPGRSRG